MLCGDAKASPQKIVTQLKSLSGLPLQQLHLVEESGNRYQRDQAGLLFECDGRGTERQGNRRVGPATILPVSPAQLPEDHPESPNLATHRCLAIGTGVAPEEKRVPPPPAGRGPVPTIQRPASLEHAVPHPFGQGR